MDDFTRELVGDFIVECLDLIDEIEPDLAGAREFTHGLATPLFRPVHSIKGGAASLGFSILAQTVHQAEDIISLYLNSPETPADQESHQFFLEFFDFIRNTFEIIKIEFSEEKCLEESERIKSWAKKIKERLTAHSLQDSVQNILIELEEVPKDNQKIESDSKDVETKENAAIDKIEISIDMIESFIAESIEAFNYIEEDLLRLSDSPEDVNPINEIFRRIHSFKGNCGIFNYHDLETLSHRMETLFDNIRSGEIKSDHRIYEQMIPFLDVLRDRVLTLTLGDKGNINSFQVHLNIIEDLLKNKNTESLQKRNNQPLSLANDRATNTKDTNKTTTETQKALSHPDKKETQQLQKRQDIRVDVLKLDKLNNLVGELVTAKNMIGAQVSKLSNHQGAEKDLRFLDRISQELQDITMDIRMVPIQGLFKRMIRIVHDISTKSGKKIELSFFGEETEIDKTIIEKISDPLVHMIRNALDHGVESPEERIKIGKPEEGRITVGAKNEAGEIWIIVQDDGKGLDKNKILAKAIKAGLMSSDATDIPDKDAYKFIFSAGFSTAEKVTDISGRGVGMDVVRQNIENVKGRIDISSKQGEGTTFTIKIPLTLAIIQGMVVRVGAEKYSLPIENIKETIKAKKEMISFTQNAREMARIRNNMIPIVRLNQVYNIANSLEIIEEGVLIIIERKGSQIALFVDHLIGQYEAVVKNLPKYFSNVRGISGCSLMSNGEACLILDVASFIDLAMQQMNGDFKKKKMNFEAMT